MSPEERLRAARRETTARLERLRADHDSIVAASADSNADDEHDPEGATIAFERSQVAALACQAGGHLAEIDEALARLETGGYGRCEGCGEPIGAERLVARPDARRCVSCAQSSSSSSRASQVASRSTGTSKSGLRSTNS